MHINEMIEERLFHEIHVSEIREFQKCHWAWSWKYVEKLYPYTSAEPLEFGTAMHAGMEARYDPNHYAQTEVAEALAIVKFNETNQKQFETAKERAGIFFDESLIEQYENRRSLGIRMLEYYFTEISKQEHDFTPIAVEQNFIVPIPSPTRSAILCYCEQCDIRWNKWISDNDYDGPYRFVGLPVVLEGKIDLVLQYENGKVWVRDWKNIGRFSDSVEWLENDLQLNLYLWALWKLGADIGGFEYFESKKMAPETPEPMKRRSSGRLYSVDKTKPYIYDTYLAEIESGDPVAHGQGLYDEYLTWLKVEGPQFYRMTKVRKSQFAMEAMEEFLRAMAHDILQSRVHTDRQYPSPTKFGCMYCEFRQPCIERMNGQPYDDMIDALFVRKKKHYYEE